MESTSPASSKGARSKVRTHRRGSVMVACLILITVTAVMTLSWVLYVRHGQEAASHDRERLHAFYAAEAGIEQVVDYFNHWEHFQGDESANYDDEKTHPGNYILEHAVQPQAYSQFEPYILQYRRDESTGLPVNDEGTIIWDVPSNSMIAGEKPVSTTWTYFRDVNAGTPVEVSLTSKVPSQVLDVSGEDLYFEGIGGVLETAHVQTIELVHPADFEAMGDELPTDQRVICKVIATGVARGGSWVRLESLIVENPTLDIRSPGAILSKGTAGVNGNFNVFWGEMWTRSNIEFANEWKNHIPRDPRMWPTAPNFDMKWTFQGVSGNVTVDKWFKLRTEGDVMDNVGVKVADGRYKQTNWLTTNPPTNSPYYNQPFYAAGATYNYNRGNTYNGNTMLEYRGLTNVQRHQNLDWPEYNYEDWKQFALQNDLPYFFTDESGNLFGKNPCTGEYGQQDWATISDCLKDGVAGTDLGYNTDAYYEIENSVVFIDSVPVDDEGNPAPLDQNGVPIVNDIYYPRNPTLPGSLVATVDMDPTEHTHGAFFIAANLDIHGGGQLDAEYDVFLDKEGDPYVVMPDGVQPDRRLLGNSVANQFELSHNGFLVSWGQITNTGSANFYGSVYSLGGVAGADYAGAGNPAVWYDYRLKDGSWLNLNQSRVRRLLWDVREGTESVDGL